MNESTYWRMSNRRDNSIRRHIIRWFCENFGHYESVKYEFSNAPESVYYLEVLGFKTPYAHNENGPAAIEPDYNGNNDREVYYLFGIQYSKDLWEDKVTDLKLKRFGL